MNKKVPMRLCVGCGEMKPKKELIRVIRTPGEEILLDTTGKQNGRGAYICKSTECLKKALDRKGLERSLKMGISKEIKENLSKEMETLVEE